MSVRPTQSLLNEITQFKQSLEDAQAIASQLPEHDQAEYIENTLLSENQKLSDFQERVSNVFDVDIADVEGISNSLAECHTIIESFTTQLSILTTSAASRHFPIAPSSTPATLNHRATVIAPVVPPQQINGNALLRDQQDEEYKVGQFKDQCAGFVGELDVFDKWLGQYIILLEYYNGTNFSSPDAKKELEKLIATVKGKLNEKIKAQELIEATNANSNNDVTNLIALKTALQTPVLNDVSEVNKKSDEAFSKIPAENKLKIFEGLKGILKRSPGLRNEEISKWEGTNAEKAQAVSSLIPASAPVAQSQKESVFMRAGIEASEELISSRTTTSTTTTSHPASTPSNSAPSSPNEENTKLKQFQELIESVRRQTFNDNNTGREEEFGFWITNLSIIRSYFLSKNNNWADRNIRNKMDEFLSQISVKLEGIVARQERAERALSNPSDKFQGLKEAIEKQGDIASAFNILSMEEKKKLLKALYSVLKRPLPPEAENSPDSSFAQFLKNTFSAWIGTRAQKLQALNTLIPAQPQSTTPALNKNAEKMRKDLDEVMNAPAVPTRPAPKPQQTTTTTTTTSSAPVRAPASMEVDFQDANSQLIATLRQLQQLLHPNQDVNRLLAALKSKGMCLFPISGTTPQPIFGRPYFHIYLIHKNESPIKLKNDMEYGMKAFTCVPGFSSSAEEQKRAIQRTIVEVALQGLEDAVNFGDGASLVQLLDILEGVTLDPRDNLPGVEKVVFKLYGLMYQLHVEARKKNNRLVDPNHNQFKNDFGRNAFRTLAAAGIESTIRVEAIKQVLSILKTTWKV